MDSEHLIDISPRDRLFRAWQNSMETVRSYRGCAEELGKDSHLGKLFDSFAEDEGLHAAEFLNELRSMDEQCH